MGWWSLAIAIAAGIGIGLSIAGVVVLNVVSRATVH
jgi:hypothetical protein